MSRPRFTVSQVMWSSGRGCQGSGVCGADLRAMGSPGGGVGEHLEAVPEPVEEDWYGSRGSSRHTALESHQDPMEGWTGGQGGGPGHMGTGFTERGVCPGRGSVQVTVCSSFAGLMFLRVRVGHGTCVHGESWLRFPCSCWPWRPGHAPWLTLMSLSSYPMLGKDVC